MSKGEELQNILFGRELKKKIEEAEQRKDDTKPGAVLYFHGASPTPRGRPNADKTTTDLLLQRRRDSAFIRSEGMSAGGMVDLNKRIHFVNNRLFELFRISSRAEEHPENGTNKIEEEVDKKDDDLAVRSRLEVLYRLAKTYYTMLQRRGRVSELVKMKIYSNILKPSLDLNDIRIKKTAKFSENVEMEENLVNQDIVTALEALYIQGRMRKTARHSGSKQRTRKSTMPPTLSHRYVDECDAPRCMLLTQRIAHDLAANYEVNSCEGEEGPGTLPDRMFRWAGEHQKRQVRLRRRSKRNNFLKRYSKRCTLSYSGLLRELLSHYTGLRNNQERGKATQDKMKYKMKEEKYKEEKEYCSSDENDSKKTYSKISVAEKLLLKADTLRIGDILWNSDGVDFPFTGHTLWNRHGKGSPAEEVLADKTGVVVLFAGLRHVHSSHVTALDDYFKCQYLRSKVGYLTVCLEGGSLELALMMRLRPSICWYTDHRGTLACSLLLRCRPAVLPSSHALNTACLPTSDRALDDIAALGTASVVQKWLGRPLLIPTSDLMGFAEPGLDDLADFVVKIGCPPGPGKKEAERKKDWQCVLDEHTVFQPELISKINQ